MSHDGAEADEIGYGSRISCNVFLVAGTVLFYLFVSAASLASYRFTIGLCRTVQLTICNTMVYTVSAFR